MIPPAVLTLLRMAAYAAQAVEAVAPLLQEGRRSEAGEAAAVNLGRLRDALANGEPVPPFRDDQAG